MTATATTERTGVQVWQKLLTSFRTSPKKTILLCSMLPVMVIAWMPVLTGSARPAPVAATGTAAPGPAVTGPTTTGPATTDPAITGPQVAGAVEATAPGSSADPNAGALAPHLDDAALQARIDQLQQSHAPRWVAHAAADPFGSTRDSADPGLDARPVDLQELAPTSIFLSAGDRAPVAMIQGRAYRPGDELRGLTITAIEERRVLFRRGRDIFSVSIPQQEIGKGNQ